MNNKTILSDNGSLLFSTQNQGTEIRTMCQMQLLGRHNGIYYQDYEDQTNWDLLGEELFNSNSVEERHDIYDSHYRPARIDEYYQELAQIAAEFGCERAELKCLAKSLIVKYDMASYLEEFPQAEFSALYKRLLQSNNEEYIKAAIKLSRYNSARMADVCEREAYMMLSYLDDRRELLESLEN